MVTPEASADADQRTDERREMTLVSAAVAVLLSALLGLGIYGLWQSDRAALRQQVEAQAGPLAHSLSSAIERRFALVHGFKGFVEADFARAEQPSYLDAFAASIRGSAGGIRALQLIRDGVIRYSHPVAGNEAAVGLDLANDPRPRVRSEFLRAAGARTLCLSGPFELIQGGMGFVARQSVYRDGALWGLVAIVLDVRHLFKDAGLQPDGTRLRGGGMVVAVKDATGRVFFGAPAVFDRQPVLVPVDLPDGRWTLAALPSSAAAPWSEPLREALLRWMLGATIVICLATSLLWTALNRRAQRRRFELALVRKEGEVWKKALRVIGHEINNSLAPISSLVHSARLVAGRPDKAPLVDRAFDTIAERAAHLREFIDRYVRLARLPAPQKRAVDWNEFLTAVRHLYAFRVVGALPGTPGLFDSAQLEQVLINLLKNAHEAGGPADQIAVSVEVAETETRLTVLDRGFGMDAETSQNATQPFFTTKATGSGLGLYLCREIVSAHGGDLRFAAREGGGTAVTVVLPSG